MKRGRQTEALKEYERAVQLNTNMVEARFGLAMTYETLGKYEGL
jgi:hypothetical protein